MHNGGQVFLAVLIVGVPALLLLATLNRAGLIHRAGVGFRLGRADAAKDSSRLRSARAGRQTARSARRAAKAASWEQGGTPSAFGEWLRYRHFKGAAKVVDRLEQRRHDRYMAREAAAAGTSGTAGADPSSPPPAAPRDSGTVRGRVVREAPPAPPAPPPTGATAPPAPASAPASFGGPPPHYAGTREPHPVRLPGAIPGFATGSAPAPLATTADPGPAPTPGASPTPAGGVLMSAGAVEQVVDGVHGIYQRAMSGGIRAKHAAVKACAEACVRFALMLEMVTRGLADEKHYGPEITEPISGAAMHLRAAAMSLGESDTAIGTMLGMSVGELADSPRQAPVHTELSETGAV